MTVGTYPPGRNGNGYDGWRQPTGPRADGKKGRKKNGFKAVSASLVTDSDNWIVKRWRDNCHLSSIWLGEVAYNEGLTRVEADALIVICDSIRKVSPDAFWDAFWKGYKEDFELA